MEEAVDGVKQHAGIFRRQVLKKILDGMTVTGLDDDEVGVSPVKGTFDHLRVFVVVVFIFNLVSSERHFSVVQDGGLPFVGEGLPLNLDGELWIPDVLDLFNRFAGRVELFVGTAM